MNSDGSLKSWERGVDRILDADILPNISLDHKHEFSVGTKVKAVELIDTWEAFHMRFMMNYPQYDETMDFVLDGNQLYFDFENMSKVPKPQKWMPVKYGQEMAPWECTVKFPNTQGNNVGQFKLDSDVQTLEYNYHI